MRNIGKVIWHFPLLGFLNAFISFLLGSFFLITVVGTPLGQGLIQISKFLMAPLSREVIVNKQPKEMQNDFWEVFGFFVRILYFPFGLFLVNLTLLQIGLLYVSVVGSPLAKVLWKFLPVFFNPVHKICIAKQEE